MKKGTGRRSRIIVLPVLLVISLFANVLYAAGASGETAGGLFWKARSESATVYLLGSIHLLKKDFYPLGKKIEDAFDASSTLAVEANIDDIKASDFIGMVEGAFYQGDDSLEKHLSPATCELVKKESANLGIPFELLEKEKPWFIALTISSFSLLQAGFDPAYGVDQYFIGKAGGKKKIEELESVDYQIRLLSGLSDAEQEMFLRKTIDDIKTVGQDTDRLIDAWKSGDEKAIESILADGDKDKTTASFFKKVLYDRNREMAGKIEGFMRGKETVFVVVGAGHLVGGKGIVSILRRKGYHVDRL